MNTDREALNKISERVIGCAYTVGNALGSGFLERVYENALAYELRKNGMQVVQQHSIAVTYDNIVVGDYVADMLIENRVLIEVKAVRALDDVHKAQCLNYLKGTGLELCLLINFGNLRVEVKRIIQDQPR
ncbi:MAG TPA: GxxExxY protein, partial [Dongiaceae bacterium]